MCIFPLWNIAFLYYDDASKFQGLELLKNEISKSIKGDCVPGTWAYILYNYN